MDQQLALVSVTSDGDVEILLNGKYKTKVSTNTITFRNVDIKSLFSGKIKVDAATALYVDEEHEI